VESTTVVRMEKESERERCELMMMIREEIQVRFFDSKLISR